jgi:hypothetical protein
MSSALRPITNALHGLNLIYTPIRSWEAPYKCLETHGVCLGNCE